MKSANSLIQAALIRLGLAAFLVACQPSLLTNPSPLLTKPPETVEQQISDKDGMVLLYVPAGEFLMGSAETDSGANNDEKPQHRVYLDAFWIDQTEVTNAMYAKCVQAGACQPPSSTASYTFHAYYGDSQYDRYPVAWITWERARSYCEWAGRRLPTEAEWEKAARGTDGRLYPWGNAAPNPTLLNFKAEVGDTTAVGNYPTGASPYGVLDMAGNLWEWVADWYDHSYYPRSPVRNPAGPSPQAYHACRGGSWNSAAEMVRAVARGNADPGRCDGIVGIRCAR
jgi:serine/threonine-protein kinase